MSKIIGRIATTYTAKTITNKYGNPMKIIEDVCLYDKDGQKYYFKAIGLNAEIIESAKTTDRIGVTFEDEVWRDKDGNDHFKAAKTYKASRFGGGYYVCSTGKYIAKLGE